MDNDGLPPRHHSHHHRHENGHAQVPSSIPLQQRRRSSQPRHHGHPPPPVAMENGNLAPGTSVGTTAGEGEEIEAHRRRSASIGSIGRSLGRILPKNRKEKGGTLRPDHDAEKMDSSRGEKHEASDLEKDEKKKPKTIRRMLGLPRMVRRASIIHKPVQDRNEAFTPSRTQELYQAKKMRREQRRSYRESEDYLIMHGVNPRSGHHENTATSSSSPNTLGSETRRALDEKVEAARRELQAVLNAKMAATEEKERRGKEKRERREARMREVQERGSTRWRSDDGEWKIVQDPELSPIQQSVLASGSGGSGMCVP